MNYGKTISNIRKHKHISIEQVTHETITKSSYTRFVEGKTQPSINNFVKLLENLHVNFEEFLYINRGFKPDYFNEMGDEIRKATLRMNVEKLQEIHDTFAVYHQQEPDHEIYHHFECITQLILNFIRHEPYDEAAKQVILDYLLKCDIWTHYEHNMFNSVIFIFSVDAVKAMESRIIKNLDKYQLMHAFGNESFRTLIVMLAYYIRHRDLLAAIKVISKLSSIELQPNMIFEKTLYKFYSGVVFILSKQENGYDNIKTALETMKLTEAHEYLYAMVLSLERLFDTYDFESKRLREIIAEYKVN